MRAYHVYSYTDDRVPIILYRTWDDDAPRYDLSNGQKFVISVARALRRRPYTSVLMFV